MGRLHKKGAIAFRKLTNSEVIELLNNHNLTEIAEMYDVTKPFISIAMKGRKLFKIKDVKYYPKNMFSKNEDDYKNGNGYKDLIIGYEDNN